MPALWVSVIYGHAESKRVEAVVDSGSDFCLFHGKALAYHRRFLVGRPPWAAASPLAGSGGRGQEGQNRGWPGGQPQPEGRPTKKPTGQLGLQLGAGAY